MSSYEPLSITGIDTDGVTEPTNDGSQGSALYDVPFLLNRATNSRERDLLEQVWDNPPRYTTMHRPGILRANGIRITLHGTTIDEVKQYHRDTLIAVLSDVNMREAQYRAIDEQKAEQQRLTTQSHKDHVNEIAGGIDFS